MPRIKRNRIKFTEESLNSMYQEVYNDTFNFKAKVDSLISKWSIHIKDEGNIAALGKEIVALMNQIGKTNDQKIVLLKLLKDIVYSVKNSETSNKSETGQVSISADAKNELMRMAEEARKGIENSK